MTANSHTPGPSALQVGTMRRVALRIVPFLMVCYFVSFLDRVNVGFAALQMVKDLHLSPAVFGFGSGIFFVSYFLCEVPSNLILQKGAPLDCTHHGHMGSAGHRHGLGDRPTFLLCDAPSAGRRGGRLFPGRDSVSHLLVSRRVSCADRRVVHRRDSGLEFPGGRRSRQFFWEQMDGLGSAAGNGCSFWRARPRSCWDWLAWSS